jgi:DNA-binding XRE family transcriptional regulator
MASEISLSIADERRFCGKHEFVWDGRGRRGDDARYSLLPGRAATDLRLSQLHFRILAHLGRFNQKKGWCRLSQIDLAQIFDVRRQSVNKAINELVEWDYLEKRSQGESGESFCLYRTLLDQPETTGGVSGKPDTPLNGDLSATADTGVRSQRTRVSPPRTPNSYRSLDVVEEEGREDSGQQGPTEHAGPDLPFSADVIRELVSMPGELDVEELISRYIGRTRSKRIGDPSAYLLSMGRDAAAKKLGISRATLAKIASRSDAERAAGFAEATEAFSKPSAECVARHRRYRNPHVEIAVQRLTGRTFVTQAAADRAFEGELAVLRFSSGKQVGAA